MCRARAAIALAEHASDDNVQAALLAAAKEDSFWAVRQEAIRALASASGDTVRQTMIDVARSDAKADVRQEAIRQLGRMSHDDTRAALRHIAADDQSYQSVAEALRALAKVDRDNCAADLLAALESPSHRDVILNAACDCLIDLKHAEASERVQALLRETADPDRKVQMISALARLRSDDPATVELLKEQIDHRRPSVRRRAFDALADLGDPRAIDWLQARREKEEQPGMVRAVDEAIEKLRGKERDLEKLRGEVESLRRKNEQLEERLKKLEEAAAK
jgi:HEAT repeat protein